jgi:hypothetical protein
MFGIAFASAIWSDRPAWGQAGPQNYGQYYSSNVGRTPSNIGSTQYLYNKYFYHSPSVSPYVNLSRRDTQSGTAYSAYVVPEQQRRAQQAQAARSQKAAKGYGSQPNYGLAPGGRPGHRPGAAASPYYNQYYRKPSGR